MVWQNVDDLAVAFMVYFTAGGGEGLSWDAAAGPDRGTGVGSVKFCIASISGLEPNVRVTDCEHNEISRFTPEEMHVSCCS